MSSSPWIWNTEIKYIFKTTQYTPTGIFHHRTKFQVFAVIYWNFHTNITCPKGSSRAINKNNGSRTHNHHEVTGDVSPVTAEDWLYIQGSQLRYYVWMTMEFPVKGSESPASGFSNQLEISPWRESWGNWSRPSTWAMSPFSKVPSRAVKYERWDSAACDKTLASAAAATANRM